MKTSYLKIFILVTVSKLVDSKNYNEDLNWRDFYGTIPQDALLVGADLKGRMYTGQVLYEGKLIPGKLYEGDKNIYFEYGEKSHKANTNIKVLCTKHPENFMWLLTKASDYRRIKNLDLVKGGYQRGFKTYVGVVFDGGEINVGKVICKEVYCLGMYAVKNEKNVEYHRYYVLSYSQYKYYKRTLYY